ncbi:hypothetical protein [Mesobacillus foraminis]|uniref:hypothetical protein n=1 Tax=Mesobacillus foraminis TaxID=279826 RepID=UPI00104741C2|nr:hypothetical protein [Mesobacillus foraminis]
MKSLLEEGFITLMKSKLREELTGKGLHNADEGQTPRRAEKGFITLMKAKLREERTGKGLHRADEGQTPRRAYWKRTS